MDRRTQLPQELIDKILENLEVMDGSVDRWTLRPCSLVCSSWVHSTRRRLFRRIVLLPPYDGGFRSYGKRLHILLLRSPHIATYIQELRLYEGQFDKGEAWIGSDQSLPLALGLLKDLKRIELRRLRWNLFPLALRQSIQDLLALPTLRFLEMERSEFASLDNFSNLLSHAKGLTSLSLREINTHHRFYGPLSLEGSSQGKEAKDQEVYAHRTHLLELHLTWMTNGHSQFDGWLFGPQSQLDLSHIQTLHIGDVFMSGVHTVNRLLHAIGSTLKHFKLGLPWTGQFDRDDVDINVGHNPNLKSLHITDIQLAPSFCRRDTEEFKRLLHCVSAIGELCPLDELRLDVRISESVEPSRWERLDCILAGTNFKSLKKVVIDEPTSHDLLDGMANVVHRLPLLRAGGVSVECI